MNSIRLYGKEPYDIVVIHGGPGAPGSMAAVAEGLKKNRGIIEPLQNAETLESQVEELHSQLSSYDSPFVIIGHSWGAWLSLIFASKHPEIAKYLILISCPPFDIKYVPSIMKNRLNNLNEEDKNTTITLLDKMHNSHLDDGEFKLFGDLMTKSDSYCYEKSAYEENPLPAQPEVYEKVWRQAAKLRETGELIELVKKINCPISFIHGKQDPHPYEGVQDVLNEHGVDFEFILFDECGHTPWKEKHKADDFYKMLNLLTDEF